MPILHGNHDFTTTLSAMIYNLKELQITLITTIKIGTSTNSNELCCQNFKKNYFVKFFFKAYLIDVNTTPTP